MAGRSLLRAARRRLLVAIDPKRRFNCADQDDPSWQERAEVAAELVARSLPTLGKRESVAVADFGCGNERLLPVLRRTLPVTVDYQGYDLHPQSPSVIQLDVQGELPARTFDVAFGLGLLEYLDDVAGFLRRLRPHSRLAALSYVTTDAPDSLPSAARRERSWLTDYTREELDAVVESAGFSQRDFAWTNAGHTGLWLLAAE
jgi:hypothetical protein